MQPRQKQEANLSLLQQTISKYFLQLNNQATAKETSRIKTSYIDEMIKKLKGQIYKQFTCEQLQKAECQTQEQAKLLKIIHILIEQALKCDRTICLQWLSQIVKIHNNTSTSNHTQSIYELAKQADSSLVIALPGSDSDIPYKVPISQGSVPDNITNMQHSSTKLYYDQDQLLINEYFNKVFYTIKRKGISQFTTSVVNVLCQFLFQNFLKQSPQSHNIQTHVKMVELVSQVEPPIYTFYLLTLFKNIISSLNSYFLTVKITSSVSNQKINRIFYTLNNISSRWEGTAHFNKSWEWQLKSKIVKAFLDSNVSQTKLTGVKLLVQFCNRVEYSMYKKQDIVAYLRDNQILLRIFAVDNHPEVISKGKHIYDFLSKTQILSQNQIQILLNLIDKSHQNVCKSIYLILQSLGQNNLTFYHQKIMTRIAALTRASLFTDQTLQLFQTLLIISPPSQIKNNMASIYTIAKKHYVKFRKHLRQKLLRLYFQLFVMGVEEGCFLQKQSRLQIAQQIASNLGTNFAALMLDSFIRVVKSQAGKKIAHQCNQILQQTIYQLFDKYKIHKCQIFNERTNWTGQINIKLNKTNYKQILMQNPLLYNKIIHLGLVKHLLQSYQNSILPLTYEDLSELINNDASFVKFIQFYKKQQQIHCVQALLEFTKKEKAQNIEHINNIVQVYSLIGQEAKKEVYDKIWSWFISNADFQQSQNLTSFLVNNHVIKQYGQGETNIQKFLQYVINQMKIIASQQKNQTKLIGYLMILKNIIKRQDKKGFGDHLPFFYSSNSYDVLVKVTNSVDVLKPVQYDLQSQNYQTIAQLIRRILEHDSIKITEVNFKINDKFMSINDLQSRVGEMVKINNKNQAVQGSNQQKHYISITVFDVFENEWFDKSQLINQGILNHEVIIALSQIFTKFTTGGKMHRNDSAKIFEMATGAQKITVNDSRIQHLYSHFSTNGQYLTLQQWLNFYQKSSQDNPGVVIDNLKKLGYAHLFKNQSQLLSQFGSSEQNVVREYIVRQGKTMYQLLFKNYQNQNINFYCLQLLKLLPIQQKFIQIITLSQNTMIEQSKIQQQKIKKNSKQSINRNFVIQQIKNFKLQQQGDNKKHLWYVLGIFSQIQNIINNKMSLSSQFTQVFSNLNKIFEIYINNVLLSSAFNQIDIQIMHFLLVFIQRFCRLKNQNSCVPKSLLDKEKNKELNFQYDEYFEDPINIQFLVQSIELGSYLNYIKIEKFAQIVQLQYNKNHNNVAFRRRNIKFKIFQVLDLMAIIFLFNAKILSQNQQLRVNQNFVFNEIFEIRSIFNNYYYLICQIHPNIKNVYYSLSFQLMKYKSNPIKGVQINQSRCDQFLRSMNKMLRLETIENQGGIYVKVTQGIEKFIKQTVEQAQRKTQNEQKIEVYTQKNSQASSESLLRGQLTILDSMKLYLPSLQISQSKQWLSKLISQHHSNSTRFILYRIAQKIYSVQHNLQNIKKLMEGVTINRNSQVRKNPRMGLFNLGAICYVNATLQQLFMIQPFRKAIIETDLKDLDISDYFYQFQHLIYQLAFGKRQFFIPDEFCLSYTDFENKPIDIKQQHDADQFLNSLFDRLQKTLSNIKQKQSEQACHLIRTNFCGELANVITCQSCFNSKVKVQDFYVLTLQIKNNKNLIQCFEKLTEPETITDYYCQQCDRKVQLIQKQIKIKKLPQFLFIHLQRLVFDLQSLSKIKLQHMVDYPQQLDLSQFFSYQYSDEQRAKYRLKGFIVHIGTSQSGHYYSLIKDQNNRWIKFDDSRVEAWQWSEYSRDKQGTYLLIYEKIFEYTEYNSMMKQQKQQKQLLHVGNLKLYEKIKLDNELLVKQTIFLQKSFGYYLLQTLSHVDIPYELMSSSPNQLQVPFHPDYNDLSKRFQYKIFEQSHDIILSYLQLVSQSKVAPSVQINAGEVQNATCFFITLLHLCPSLTNKTVDTLLYNKNQTSKIKNDTLRRMLVHSDKTIRQAYKLIYTKLLSIMLFTAQQSSHTYLIPYPEHTTAWYIQKILQYQLGALFDASKNYSKMQQYFQFTYFLTKMSTQASEWFQAQDLGPRLIQFICNDSPAVKLQIPNYNYNNDKKTESINSIVKIMYNLLQVWIQKNKCSSDDLTNSTSYKAYILSKWHLKIYTSRYQYQCCNQILSRLLQVDKSRQLSNSISLFVLQKLNRFSQTDQYIIAYIDLMARILKVKDGRQRMRCQQILGIPKIDVQQNQNISSQSTRYYKYCVNQFLQTDQHMLPILQLLFTNRLQTNYFTITGTSALLRLMTQYNHVYEYVTSMPAPLPYNYYTDWMDILLKNGIKKDIIIGSAQDKKSILNQISQLMNSVESKLMTKQGNDSQQPLNQMNMDEQNNNTNFKTVSNKMNILYRLKGLISQTFTMEFNQNQEQKMVYKLVFAIMNDEKDTKILRFRFSFDETIIKIQIGFTMSAYQYTFISKCRQFQIITPYAQQLLQTPTKQQVRMLFQIQILQKKQIKSSVMVNQSQVQAQNKQVQPKIQQYNADIIMQQESSNVKPTQNYDQIFQCPFCTSISYSFASRCPTCGEQWGEMA